MNDVKIPDEIAAMHFEQAIAELETLVSKMETGGLTLDRLMQGYERGRLLTEHCRKQLAELERKISILSGDDGKDGVWKDFDPSGNRNGSPSAGTDTLPF